MKTKLMNNFHEEFINAASFGNLKECERLLELSQKNNYRIQILKNEALIRASRSGYLEICELLLRYGANVHAQGDSALKHAAEYGHVDICKLLVQHGANIHALNDYALRYAAKNGHLRVCQLLLEHGAKIYDYALKYAIRKNHPEVCKLLLQHGANPNIVVMDGYRKKDYALEYALKRGRSKVCKVLLEHDVYNWSGSILLNAIRHKYQSIRKLSLNHILSPRVNSLRVYLKIRKEYPEYKFETFLEEIKPFATSTQIDQLEKEYEVYKIMDS